VLLYADDTILMSNNPTSLQKSLNDFVNYCQEWKLEINFDKTKAMTFGARTNRKSVLKVARARGVQVIINRTVFRNINSNYQLKHK